MFFNIRVSVHPDNQLKQVACFAGWTCALFAPLGAGRVKLLSGMKSFLTRLALFLLISSGCFGKGLTPEQAVYETLLLAFIGNTYDHAYLIDETDAQWFREYPIEHIFELNQKVGIDPGLLERLYAANKRSQPINWKPVMVSVDLLPSSVHKSKDRSESCFDQDHQLRRYHTLSRVAFSDDGMKAVVKHGYHCAALSGGVKHIILFRKDGRRWVVDSGIVISRS